MISFHLDDVSCTGNETKLVNCTHLGVGIHNCRLGIDEAAVICTGEHRCMSSLGYPGPSIWFWRSETNPYHLPFYRCYMCGRYNSPGGWSQCEGREGSGVLQWRVALHLW